MNGLSEEATTASQLQENEDAVSMTQGEISDFLTQIEELTPTIPDVVAAHYLNKAGVDTTDPRISRILALAAQKFLSDIINDALQTSKLKGSQQSRAPKGKEKKYVLSLEDLAPTLAEYGIIVKKPAYYT